MNKKKVDVDDDRLIRLSVAVVVAPIGWIVAFGLLYLGMDLGIGSAALSASVLTAIALGVVSGFFTASERAVDRLFGAHREVDTAENEWESLRDKATESVRNGEFEAAVHYHRAMFQMPQGEGSVHLAMSIATLYEDRLRRYEDALYWRRKASSLIRETRPDDPEGHPMWSEIHESIEALTGLIHHGRSLATQAVEKARGAIGEGDFDAANAALKDAVRRFPEEVEAWFLLGVCEGRSGQPGLAVERYKEAVRLDPGHTRALFNLAGLYHRLDRLQEARETWLRYLSAAGEEAGEREFLPEARRMLEETEQALRPEIESV